MNKFAFKLAMSETVDLFLLTRPCCPVEHWTDILWERDVGKTYPHSLVEPSCHNPFENYWELPICWPETWKYENDKQINPNCWTEYWKLKTAERICSGPHLPHCWATPLPKVIAEKWKRIRSLLATLSRVICAFYSLHLFIPLIFTRKIFDLESAFNS